MQARKGFQFYEGDIVLDEQMLRMMMAPSGTRARRTRAIVKPLSRLWRYGRVPYLVDSSVSSRVRRLIPKAIAHYANKTCVRFIPRTNQRDYVVFINQPGCWSSVGKVGGIQYVSLGAGCERLGTVLHEMGHVVGFWHQQARHDRDEFVRIVERNIPASYGDQFSVVPSAQHNTRGYAYDYQSLMHYGKYDFSANGRPTIEIKGPGKQLGLRLGQNQGLSALDVAKLRDMYYCNRKSAVGKVCKAGWKRHKDNCYKFVSRPTQQFTAAQTACRRLNATLLSIDTASEDKFIKGHLLQHARNQRTWRTGGRRNGQHWRWSNRPGSQSRFNFNAWEKGGPTSDSLVLLRFETRPPTYKWWSFLADSASNPDKYKFPFICEMPGNVTTFKSKVRGRNYRGNLDYTQQGITCQHWTSQYPHNHTTLTGDWDIDGKRNGLGDHNFCRNPNKRRARPWCYTTKPKREWQYCDVRIV